MTAVATAFAAHMDDWAMAVPAVRLSRVLLASAWSPREQALGFVEHEWLGTALVVNEARVRAARFGWWAEELGRWSQGHARHPVLAQIPVDAATAAALGAALAAASQLAELDSVGSAADLADGVAAVLRPLRPQPAPAALRAHAAALLCAYLRDWPAFALAERGRVPLLCLARVGMTRAAAQDSDPRVAQPAFAAVVQDLAALMDAGAAPAPGSDGAGFDRLLRRIEHDWSRRALRAPAAAFAGAMAPWTWRTVFACWRLARAARRRPATAIAAPAPPADQPLRNDSR